MGSDDSDLVSFLLIVCAWASDTQPFQIILEEYDLQDGSLRESEPKSRKTV